MSREIVWSAVAKRDLRAIPWRLAARIDAAVMAFAGNRAGEGAVERVTAADPSRLRLRLAGATALLWIEPGTGMVHVARVLRGG